MLTFRRARMLAGMIGAAMLLLSTSQPMQARTVTTVVTGTVASGYDTSGVFGPPTTYLDSKPFTLTFTTDDTKGTIVCSSGCSGIYSTFNVNPTTATLQIGTGSYTFGTMPRSNGGANGASSSVQLNGDVSSNSLAYKVNDVLNGSQDYVQGGVYPPAGTIFPITSWEGFFSSPALATPPISQQLAFSINILGRQASGSLIPSTIAHPAPALNTVPPTFASMSIIPTGASASGASLMAAVADFNSDGKPDIATTNINDSTVSILSGNGNGTFQTARNYRTGKGPYGIVTGTFGPNGGSGGSDLAIVNGLDNTFSILLNNSQSGFPSTPSATYSVGSEPFGISAAVLDNYNHEGVVVTNNASNSLSVWLNEGQAAVSYQTGNSPFGTVTADMNHDGLPDIVSWNYADNTIGVLLNVNQTYAIGTFSTPITYPAGDTPFSVATGYFNNDGSPDLAVANLGDNTITVFLNTNDGTGRLLSGTTYAAGSLPTSVLATDLNGDSYTDLATANLGDGTISVLLGKGDGTFLPQTLYAAGTQPYSLQSADFNSDGKPDLLVSNFFSPSVGVLLQTSSATSSRMKATPPRLLKAPPQ